MNGVSRHTHTRAFVVVVSAMCANSHSFYIYISLLMSILEIPTDSRDGTISAVASDYKQEFFPYIFKYGVKRERTTLRSDPITTASDAKRDNTSRM